MGLSLSPERGHEGRSHEVPKEDCCSSMYSNNMHFVVLYLRVSMCRTIISVFRENQYVILIAVYFRLKINHDIHEFTLDSGTVANRWYLANFPPSCCS